MKEYHHVWSLIECHIVFLSIVSCMLNILDRKMCARTFVQQNHCTFCAQLLFETYNNQNIKESHHIWSLLEWNIISRRIVSWSVNILNRKNAFTNLKKFARRKKNFTLNIEKPRFFPLTKWAKCIVFFRACTFACWISNTNTQNYTHNKNKCKMYTKIQYAKKLLSVILRTKKLLETSPQYYIEQIRFKKMPTHSQLSWRN